MAKSSTSFKKGQSGNPGGRPPKERALTALLEATGNKKIEYQGKQIEARQVLAELLWSAATTGKVHFADGRVDVVSSDDWFDIARFIYTHVDGSPTKQLDVTSAGEQVAISIFGVISDDDDDNSDDQAI